MLSFSITALSQTMLLEYEYIKCNNQLDELQGFDLVESINMHFERMPPAPMNHRKYTSAVSCYSFTAVQRQLYPIVIDQ